MAKSTRLPVRIYRETRIRMGETQQEFWCSMGVSQSGGSRFETGTRRPPLYVEMLFRLIKLKQSYKTAAKEMGLI